MKRSTLLLRSSSLSVRFICDNLALPVPCHWERINTDEPYQVGKTKNKSDSFKVVFKMCPLVQV